MNTIFHVLLIVMGHFWGLFHSQGKVCVNASIVRAHSKHDLQMEKRHTYGIRSNLYLKGLLESRGQPEQGNKNCHPRKWDVALTTLLTVL